MANHPPMTRTASSNVRCFGYDADAGDLWVGYRNTPGFYVYEGVPPVLHHGLLAAESKGRSLHEHVLGRFPHHQVG